MKNVYIIQNPVAGTKPGEEVKAKIRQHFEDLGWVYEIYQTTGEEDVTEIARQACQQKCDLIVAAGGDGTVAAVASAVAGTDQVMGILPVGTGNALARDLRIPLQLEPALDVLGGENRIQKIDAMEIEGKYYLLNVSAGLTPSALKLTSREEKQRLGRMAYFLAGFRALVGIQPVTFFIEVDGVPHTRRASELLLMNSVTLGETGRYLNLDIENHDGKLDLFIVEARTIGDYLRIVWNLAIRHPKRDPDLERFTVRETLVIRTQRFLEVQADGELIGYTPKTVRLKPEAVSLVLPAEKPPTLGEQIISQLPGRLNLQ